MTKEQLDWLIEYVNAKCLIVDHRAARNIIPLHLTDRAAELREMLERSVEEQP